MIHTTPVIVRNGQIQKSFVPKVRIMRRNGFWDGALIGTTILHRLPRFVYEAGFNVYGPARAPLFQQYFHHPLLYPSNIIEWMNEP